jgi:hypothetical protein
MPTAPPRPGEGGEQGLIEQFIAQLALEAFDEGVLGRLAGEMECHLIGISWLQRSIARQASSVPLSETHIAGGPEA